MNRRFGRLPPLTSLEGFEAAARLGSFSLASAELNITQSAVSHQIKALEEFFGQPLFRRVKRSVILTDAGRDFLETATRMLGILSQGQHRLDHYLKPGSVVLATTPMIARKWLLPRLSTLKASCPDIQPCGSTPVMTLLISKAVKSIWPLFMAMETGQE
ncbi:LysR family transcriptional regulator [Kiloniella laminariae]|uniref:LysR family transcriptional regulator n=1 Tax=Kiloniella laminariae TaxID=454162 RepID=A0ABT4LDR3_9PROT|nr:LysR family transcriptional regulator [Kiloniella laminariae]MCZ4279236.1 LysR family transcriptional regulator [Kiloniella laminariae]